VGCFVPQGCIYIQTLKTLSANCADELLPVFVVLQILAPLDDTLYDHYLSRLAVSLEVTAIDDQRQRMSSHPSRGPEASHLLFHTLIDEKQTPRLPMKDVSSRLAVWKLQVPLGHPRARLNNPKVVITCSATLRPAELQQPQLGDEYMTSRTPVGINLLDPYSTDPSLSHIAPRLSALRVSRVIPVTETPQQSIRPLGYAAKRAFGIFPAINIRLRYSRIVSGSKQSIIASLDLEITTFRECDVCIKKVDITVAGGHAELVGDTSTLPITCQPRDDVTFLYTLSQNDSSSSPKHTSPSAHVRPLSVSLEAVALVSEECRPHITTNWTTTVDFSPPVAQQFAPSPGIQRAHRPPSLGSIIHGATVSSSTGIRPVFQPAATPSPNVVFTPPMSAPASSPVTIETPQQGLTVTFIGPSRVFVGEVFTWTVFVVNRSSRTRKLALIVPPKRRKIGEGKVLPAPPPGDPPEAVIDEAMVYQTHRSQYLEPAELVPLVNDVRVGPLMPSACHTAELKFVALTTGLLGVEGIRVIDLNTNETTDCRELPCIVSVGQR